MTGPACGWIRLGIRLKKTMLPLGVSLVFPLQALAADSGGDWRSTYDVVMMWLNFGILTALLVKFLRKPLGRFLTSQRDAIKKTFDDLEIEKARINDDIQALRNSMAARRQKAEERHRRMVEQARRERRDIIESARQEAQRRIAKARQQVDARHREACTRLRNEIIDAAVAKAMSELPRKVTPEEEQGWVNLFLKSITPPKR